MDNIKEAIKKLKKYNQTTILSILNKIDKSNQEKLATQIIETNFDEILELYKNRNQKQKAIEEIKPIEFIDKNKLSEEQKREFSKLGEKVIKNNQYAVVTMAGGQGTRLGHKGPKGTYKLDIGEKGKYIFEILVDTLKRASIKYEVDVNWYIMTSIENHNETIQFFESHNYFGYNKEKVKFFYQSGLPMIDEMGNILIGSNSEIKNASNGNGGIYKALKDSGMISDMKKNGIEWIYVCGVDNIMVNMVDSLILGLAINKKVPSASKSVKKSYPEEKVGIFCKKNDKPAIIEYIDMNEDMIYAKNQDGELLYGESNIISHLFNIEALEKIASYDLEYHCAHKKGSYINEELKEVIPTEPNCYKFETFIFDGFKYLDDMLILRVNREEEFAPIKNAEGIDSPKTAKTIYDNYFKMYKR